MIVVGIRFKPAGKIYYFDPQQIPLEVGDGVIVETSKGVVYGEVVIGRRQVGDGEVVKPLKPIMRKATPRDREKLEENHQKEKRAFAICREKIEKHKLDMKLISVEYTFDGNNNYQLHTYDALGGESHDYSGRYAIDLINKGTITINPQMSDYSNVTYTLVKLTSKEMV